MSLISSALQQLAQQNFLQRQFYEALYPSVKFLALAPFEEYKGRDGDTVTRTVSGRKKPKLIPLVPGQDPIPEQTSYEWFTTTISQFGDTDDVPMNQAFGTIEGAQGFFMQKMKELGGSCGSTMNLLTRNALYNRYMAGNAVTTAAGGPGVTVPVSTLNGFREVIVNGQPTTISVNNPRTITIGGVSRLAVGFNPTYAQWPDGPGTLTISVAHTWDADVPVLAADRSVIIRPGQASTIDDLQANDVPTVALFQRAAAQLKNDGVKPIGGFYQVHISPFVEQELANDNAYQRLHEGIPSEYLKAGAIGHIGDLMFFRNDQTPQPGDFNSPDPLAVPTRGTLLDKFYCAELRNKSNVQIERSIVVGAGAISQLYVDEMANFISEAGYIGKQGPKFAIMDGGALQMVMGENLGNVRVIIRPPLDRAGQQVAITWTATRGHPVYANLLSGQSAGRYKRAMVVETGHEPIG